MAASPPPSRFGPPFLLLLLFVVVGHFTASASAAGELSQVVGRGADGPYFEPFNVSYDHRAVRIGGQRRMLVSAGVHYPRATPEVRMPSAACARAASDATGKKSQRLVELLASGGAGCSFPLLSERVHSITSMPQYRRPPRQRAYTCLIRFELVRRKCGMCVA